MKISPVNMIAKIAPLSEKSEKNGGNNKQNTNSEDRATFSDEAKSTLNSVNADSSSTRYDHLHLSPQGKALLMQIGEETLFPAPGGSVDLAGAVRKIANHYDWIHSDLQEKAKGPDDKYENFWNDAFENLVNSILEQNAEQLREGIVRSPPGTTTTGDVNPFLVSAQKIADTFSAAFLIEYKANGFDAAWESGMNALGNMPETTSLFDISYNDFQALNKVFKQGVVLTEYGAADLLNGNDLSDYMKDVVGRRFDY